MKIQFNDTFLDSLNKIRSRNTWFFKIYDLFVVDIPRFVKNVWFFRKQLWKFNGFDYRFNIDLFSRSLEKTVRSIEMYSYENNISKPKKIEKIRRFIELCENLDSDLYVELAEKELGKIKLYDIQFEDVPNKPGLMRLVDNEPIEDKEHNSKVFSRAREIEKEQWEELCHIFKGQNHNDYLDLYNKLPEEEKKQDNLWENWFDGSGLKSWWY
jgi:hypothetical protein